MLAEKEKVEIDGYFVIRNDRNADGGGTLLAIKNEYKHVTIEVNRSEKQYKEESLWIVLGSTGQIRIGIIYTPKKLKQH